MENKGFLAISASSIGCGIHYSKSEIILVSGIVSLLLSLHL